MDAEPVVLRTYPTEIAAELARAALEAHGVAALVQRSDAAGLLRYGQGVQLVVRRDEVALATEILDAAEVADEGP
jgi:hypothetical protein